MTYRIYFTRQAAKDVRRLTPKLQKKLKEILRCRIAVDPYAGKAEANTMPVSSRRASGSIQRSGSCVPTVVVR